ncbi:MAG: twin-arginine translocation signal domain-containing protein, partial [Verrucomicrobiota bacterium]
MSSDRRDFLKTLTLGGIALFTADWFNLVEETKAASCGKILPALPGEKVSYKGDQLRAFWNDSEGYFELCLNGTIYDEVPDLDDDDEEEFDSSEFEQDEDESDEDFEERVEAAREEWESEHGSSREARQEEHEFDWYRRSCPGAQAVPYLQGLFSKLEASSDKVDAGDFAEVGSIDFYDGACPGNDTYV